MQPGMPAARDRRAEIVIASLFIVTAIGAIVAGALLDGLLEDPGALAGIAAHRAELAGGAAALSVNNIGIVFIAVFAYPVLARHDRTLALGYLATRIVEAGIMMGAVVLTLAIAMPGEGAEAAPWTAELDALRRICAETAMLPLLGFGGLIFTGLIVRHDLLPRWLGWFGVVSYALVIAVGLAVWFGLAATDAGDLGMLLMMPVALWEIVLMPVRLYWKGFATG